MNLYLISQHTNCKYDTYDSAVVAAVDADDAKTIHPSGDWNWGGWCDSPTEVTAKLIGMAAPGVERGVVLASYNAG